MEEVFNVLRIRSSTETNELRKQTEIEREIERKTERKTDVYGLTATYNRNEVAGSKGGQGDHNDLAKACVHKKVCTRRLHMHISMSVWKVHVYVRVGKHECNYEDYLSVRKFILEISSVYAIACTRVCERVRARAWQDIRVHTSCVWTREYVCKCMRLSDVCMLGYHIFMYVWICCVANACMYEAFGYSVYA